MMKLSRTNLVLILTITAIVTGCTNRDKKANEVDFSQLFFEYTVTGDESLEQVTCLFQYKAYDAEGEAVNIEPAKVELDGEQISPDSARLSGFFYEAHKPVESFAGKHAVVFIGPDKKQYKNEFEFYPFTLAEELPGKINRKPFSLQLRNFPEEETQLRLLMLDTAFESRGFNDLVPVRNGKIFIGEDILNQLKNGPINLELYLEQEKPLGQTTKAGGRISITYGLKRAFDLED